MYHANDGDVAFVCGPLNKNVHSFLLGARSTVFDRMLQSRFQVRHPHPIRRSLTKESPRKDIVSGSS